VKFRIGHEVRYEILVDAANPSDAEKQANKVEYQDWDHEYLTIEDCVALEESPVNPQFE